MDEPEQHRNARVRDAQTLMRSTPAWKRWVEQTAELDRAPSVADFIDRAIAAYARDRGYPTPPKR